MGSAQLRCWQLICARSSPALIELSVAALLQKKELTLAIVPRIQLVMELNTSLLFVGQILGQEQEHGAREAAVSRAGGNALGF